MLALAVSLLFGFAAFVALAVIQSSVLVGARRTRAILAELGEIERRTRIARPRLTAAASAPRRSRPALQPLFAAA